MKKMIIIYLFNTTTCSAMDATCWNEAGNKYNINTYLLYAMAKTESKLNPKAIGVNKNGSYDIGLMQINSSWLPALKKYGIQERDLFDACTNIHVGAWILSQSIRKYGYTWEAIGHYNAATFYKRKAYEQKIQNSLTSVLTSSQESYKNVKYHNSNQTSYPNKHIIIANN